MANQLEQIKQIDKYLSDLISRLKDINSQIIDISKSTREVTSSLDKIKTPSSLNESIEKANDNTKSLNAVLQEQSKIERQLISTIAKKALIQSDANKKLTKEREEIKILNIEQRNQLKAVSEIAGAYTKLSSQTNILIKRYQDLAVRQAKGEELTAKETRRLEKLGQVIEKNQGILKKTDAEVGRFQRNVGNYASGFNGLSVAVSQIAREAPAAAVSLNTFILGISNNIPMLQDELNKLILKNKELIAQGKPTESIFKKLAASLVSPQVLLAGLVTVFTLYNKQIIEFISNAINGGAKVRDLAKNQKILNEAYKEAAKSAASEISQLQLLLAVASDKTKSDQTRKKAVDKLIDSSGGLIKEQDRLNILNGKAVEIENKLVKAILNKAIIQQLQTKISEDINKLLENQIKIRKNEQDNLIEIDKLRKLGLITSKDEVEAIEELNKKIQSRNELSKKSTLRSIDFIAASTRATESVDRASKRFEENNKKQKENEVIQKNINNLIKEALKLTDDYTLSLDNNTKSITKRNKALAQDLKTVEDSAKDTKKLSDLFGKLFKDFDTKSVKDAKEDLDALDFESVERYADALKNAKSFELPEIDQSSINKFQEEFGKLKIFEILDEEVKNNLEDSLEDLGNIISNFTGVNGQKFQNFFSKLFEVGGRTFRDLADVAETSFDVLGESANAYFNNKIEQYEYDIEANNEYYANLLENETLTDSERDRLEADRAAKEEEIRKKQRKEQEKAAKFQKAIALAQIAIDLAKTITAINLAAAQLDAITFGVGGIAYRASALPQAIGLAAVQTAAVLGAPVPKFAEGGVMFKDGLMMINDHNSGRLEVVERDGKLLMTNERNAIVEGKKGDIIHKDAKEYFNKLSDDDILKDVNKHSFIASLQHQNYMIAKLENIKSMNNDKLNTDRIVKAINSKKTKFKFNQNINIGEDLSFLKRLDF